MAEYNLLTRKTDNTSLRLILGQVNALLTVGWEVTESFGKSFCVDVGAPHT